jgi:hypothetical protein
LKIIKIEMKGRKRKREILTPEIIRITIYFVIKFFGEGNNTTKILGVSIIPIPYTSNMDWIIPWLHSVILNEIFRRNQIHICGNTEKCNMKRRFLKKR